MNNTRELLHNFAITEFVAGTTDDTITAPTSRPRVNSSSAARESSFVRTFAERPTRARDENASFVNELLISISR